ncbi:hypothetical protein [Ornithinimicrobium pekingense]|uniref:DUF317 domain-containing protein n=1 Tax=Ornithinimicrobium pekingense TaxID=384677 RepID=A0ABQ2F4P7_9MICO|nr:hypothetical protein [Ornithinimicrobium pekingense]GGK58931.1 hypothetical protein GCM10011509_04120 [Ornithinimicrobium pekingense]
MKPSPGEVASRVTAIVESPWPRHLEDGLPWLQSFGIDTDTAEETPRRGADRSWHMAAMPSWGAVRAGWGTYRDEFADIFWFLWDGESSADVLRAADDLARALTDVHGDPREVTEATQYSGGSWWWQLEQHSIEMYAYSGAVNPDGYPTGSPCVQLQIDLRAVAEPREAEARRTHG